MILRSETGGDGAGLKPVMILRSETGGDGAGPSPVRTPNSKGIDALLFFAFIRLACADLIASVDLVVIVGFGLTHSRRISSCNCTMYGIEFRVEKGAYRPYSTLGS